MITEDIRKTIVAELPNILKTDKKVQDVAIRLLRRQFADKKRTKDRIDRILDELAAERERQDKRWEELRIEREKRWAEQEKKWEEQKLKWEEQNKKWWENQKAINQMLEEIKALSRKHDSTLGALGARWGLRSEQSFRNALKGILKDTANLEVVNVAEFDDEGVVFGRPDQVELDIIIRNGLLYICEIKSSMSKADMIIFKRKADFYQRRHNREATKLVVISPMVDPKAMVIAKEYGIEVYSYIEDVEFE